MTQNILNSSVTKNRTIFVRKMIIKKNNINIMK